MKVAFYTLGCKVNQYETAVLERRFKYLKYEIVDHNTIADIYIINSCTVTSVADKKTKQIINRFKRLNKNSIIALIGCFVQAFPEKANKIDDVDIVLGSSDKFELPKHIENIKNNYNLDSHISKTNSANINNFSSHLDRTRAYLKIEDGCDRYCSYCIIPKARGPVKSKSIADIKKEIKEMSNTGFKEIVLVGINLSNYGRDFKNNTNLLDVVELASSFDNIERIRLGSLEPNLLNLENIKKLSDFPKLCQHFHLSLQSGSDRILKKMNRQYSKKDFINTAYNIKKHFSNPTITTDIIVGFPHESLDDFSETIDLLNIIKFLKIHIFPFSPRQGTKASLMSNQVSNEIKKQRIKFLENEAKKIQNQIFHDQLNNKHEVLFEKSSNGYFFGYSKNYIPIKVDTNLKLSNKIKLVKIVNIDKNSCIGELV